MKSEAELSLLARQWGATAVPFGLVNANDWLETAGAQQALNCLSQTAALRSVLLLERTQRRGQKCPGRPLDALAGPRACFARSA